MQEVREHCILLANKPTQWITSICATQLPFVLFAHEEKKLSPQI